MGGTSDWDKISQIKQRWKVFRALKILEPFATNVKIQQHIETEYNITLSAAFIQGSLTRLMRDGYVIPPKKDNYWRSVEKESALNTTI